MCFCALNLQSIGFCDAALSQQVNCLYSGHIHVNADTCDVMTSVIKDSVTVVTGLGKVNRLFAPD